MLISKKNKLSPLLKYPGGKGRELSNILPHLPKDAVNYYEPFVGGGAVYFAVDAARYYINDISSELMQLYNLVREQDDEFFSKLIKINLDWMFMAELIERHYLELLDIFINYCDRNQTKEVLKSEIKRFVSSLTVKLNGLIQKQFIIDIERSTSGLVWNIKNRFCRMRKLEKQKGRLPEPDLKLNFEAAFKSAYYMHLRYLYNNQEKLNISQEYHTAIYLFIREYCFSSMYRYNQKGEFNVPYGGISYNRKDLSRKIKYYKSKELLEHLNATIMENLDFLNFLRKHKPTKQDFIFIDPPYDTEFNSYAGNEFVDYDQKRLAEYLLNSCEAYFMLIIKDTKFIRELYPAGASLPNNRKLKINSFDKQYMVSFQNRNNKEAVHLVITNY